MPSPADRARLLWPLLRTAVSVAGLMIAFELCKQFFFPSISIWQSHVVTIIFTTLLAVCAAYLVSRKLAAVSQQLQAELVQRQKMTQVLEDSYQRYRSLFENNKAGVFRCTLEGRFLDCNEAFARMFGYTREELMQLPADILFVGGPDERAQRFAQSIETLETKDVEVCYLDKNGNHVWAIQNISLVKDRNGNDVSEGTVVDVTERHELGERLRQAEKMEAVGRLAGGIAHDFNNLLAVILGYTVHVREHLNAGDRMQEPLTRINGAATQAAELVHQLLAFGRKQVLQVKAVNLNLLVQKMESMLRRVIGEHIQLIVHTKAHLKHVKVDPTQMEQVIMNLAVNARDAMPNGGRLILETANANLDQDYAMAHPNVTPGPYVMLAVTDTGHGMAPETQAHIFEPFFTTKSLGRGTGLGLSTVDGIVNQSGGHIRVYSEPGRGTTFRLYLPQAAAPDTEPLKAADLAQPVAKSNETVLLVEDEPQVRELVYMMLTASGYAVLSPENAKTALLMAERYATPIHLLLTDFVMPEINGPELARRIKAHRPDIKVLFMSGYTENIIEQHGKLDPDAYFLQKPFTPFTLAVKVREVLDGPAAIRQIA
jgi:PAS domain S-box-containing protein